jgi:hypothetical protein
MKRTRLRLGVACLAVVAAAFAVSGGSAGNRDGQPTLEVVPGPAAVTYGENIAYTATFYNNTNSMFTQVRFVMAPPTGLGTDVATPVTSSCGADAFDPVTNVLTCNVGQLAPGVANKLTVTVVWKAPEGATKSGCFECLSATGTWLIKEGKDTNGNETFALTRKASLLGVNDADPTLSNLNRAGGYELGACATGGTNLSTNTALDATKNPVVSSFCLPASFQPANAAGGVASTITEPSGGANFARQSLICIAKPGENCPDGTPATFDDQFIVFTFKVADAALPNGFKITQVFHNSTTTALPKCKPLDADNTDPNGCVVSIDPPKGPGIKTWTIVAKAKTNGPWNW